MLLHVIVIFFVPDVGSIGVVAFTGTRARRSGAGGVAVEESSGNSRVAHGQAQLPVAALAQRTSGVFFHDYGTAPPMIVVHVPAVCKRDEMTLVNASAS